MRESERQKEREREREKEGEKRQGGMEERKREGIKGGRRE